MIKKYPKYKDTGIEWLGQIPEHWNIRRIKDFTYVKGRIGWQGLRSDDFLDNSNWYCVTGTDFKNGTIDWDNSYYVDESRYLQDKKIQLKKLDLLVTKDGTIGKIALVNSLPKKATLNSGVFLTRPLQNKYSNRFMFWVLSSNSFKAFIDYNKNGSTILHLYQNVFERFFYPLPPKPEQTAIAHYLNQKTKSIDQKIALLKQKAGKYQELRKALINQTVTKGLDKNTIWKKYRLKDIGYIYSGLSSKTGDDFKQINNLNNKEYIPFTNIANNTYIDVKHLGKVLIYPNEKQNKVKKNDIFFLMSSEGYEDIGKSALLKDDIQETYLNSFCKGFRITKSNIDAVFVNYLLLSDNNRKKMIVQGKGFTRINLKIEKVNNFLISIPSTKEEQTAIAQYLDKKTAQIDAILDNIDRQINTLQEYRKTLINEVVTGKIKVIG